MVKETEETVERINAIKSDNATISATAQHLSDRFGSLNSIKSVKQLEFELDGKKQYVQVAPFQDDNLDWLIVLTVPEADFMAQIQESRRNALYLSLGALLIAIAVGIFTSRWVTRPILEVSQASDELAKGNLEQQVASSPIIEINTLANSFNSIYRYRNLGRSLSEIWR